MAGLRGLSIELSHSPDKAVGKTTLVLLPGMDGTGTLFADFIAALGPTFETVVVRYPENEQLGYSALEQTARNCLPTDRPFVLLGESFSGPIAISIAAGKPKGLLGLVLCCSFACNPRPAFSWLSPLCGLLPFGWVPKKVLSWLLLGSRENADLAAKMMRAVTQVHARAMRTRLREVLRVDVSNKLRRVEIPVMYLQALQDRVVPPSAAEFIVATARHTRVVALAAPHFLLQTVPHEAVAALREFTDTFR